MTTRPTMQQISESRRDVADAEYEAYDLSPYVVEDHDGWSYVDGAGPCRYSRTVYLIPPRANGRPGDVETDASVAGHFSIEFAAGSAQVTSVVASLNGEDIGKRGSVPIAPEGLAPDDPTGVEPVQALAAILALIEKRYDDPVLNLFGPLRSDDFLNIARIAGEGVKGPPKSKMRELHVAFMANTSDGRMAPGRMCLSLPRAEHPSDGFSRREIEVIERRCLAVARRQNPSFVRATVQSWQWLQG